MSESNPVKKNSDQILDMNLKINEIFYSIQGESRYVGLPTVFIRLTGCPLRCNYCDTEYAFNEGKSLSLNEILHTTSRYRSRYVTVTGGEPLAQKGCIELLGLLCDEGYQVSLETSGAIDISKVDERVCKVVDLKTPASGEAGKNRYSNLEYLTVHDQIKFVMCDEQDYEWARDLVQERQLYETCEVLFSPSHNQLSAVNLAEWILRDHLPVRLQIQLHKELWGDVPGK